MNSRKTSKKILTTIKGEEDSRTMHSAYNITSAVDEFIFENRPVVMKAIERANVSTKIVAKVAALTVYANAAIIQEMTDITAKAVFDRIKTGRKKANIRTAPAPNMNSATSIPPASTKKRKKGLEKLIE